MILKYIRYLFCKLIYTIDQGYLEMLTCNNLIIYILPLNYFI